MLHIPLCIQSVTQQVHDRYQAMPDTVPNTATDLEDKYFEKSNNLISTSSQSELCMDSADHIFYECMVLHAAT